ncbi:PREDICTED: uncharacterized protein LOC109342548 isoform X4 [Lupinus angustifolius]|uniref:uncharacterized protein LOC109342548 isoform X4 n=1 Tax=Lupinus angustifolius TaxID=3871 RepID=UPI00092E8B78|nr:PREDICTED: uncharacterized protein LOC109342548 isoform X4 [Lupinus angustifolius]
MGCGKSKHDVASDNTLQRKKSSNDGQKNGTETIHNNADNIVSSEIEQNNNENVKDVDVGGTVDESNDVKDKSLEVKEDKAPEKVVAKEPISEKPDGKKDDSLKENDAPPPAAKEEKKPENQQEEEKTKDIVQKETLTNKEETKDTNQKETLAKEVEAIEKIVPTSNGEEKDLNAEKGK